MIAYTYYENDNRVRRYAEALVKRGDHVDVVALQNRGFEKQEVLKGVNVYRIQKRAINEKYQLQYLLKIVAFLVRSGVFVTKKHLRSAYDVLHIHSVPDFAVFSALIPKLQKAKIILDIHDIVPEFYASKFRVSKDSLIFKTLVLMEKASIAFSNHVIIANHIWQKKLLSRSARAEKCSVVLNYPDAALFQPRKVRKDSHKLVFIYPGTLAWHQGIDIALKAFALIKDELDGAEFHIYGDGTERKKLQSLVSELGIGDSVIFRDLVPMDEIADVMASADIGVVPKRNDFFGGEAFSTKIFEFMSLGVPVIAAATTIDTYYFNDSVLEFFEPGNEKELARTMLLLAKNKKRQDMLSRNALQFVGQYSWDKKRQEYLDLLDGLVNAKGGINDKNKSFVNALLNMYYYVKPLIPRQFQLFLRRRMVLQKLPTYSTVWPIDEVTAKIPVGWIGWPDNKRFALVLTHDVEGEDGVSKCLQLAKLEEDLGLRSSFNFVAEDYQVPLDLLDNLRKRGFEIGLHGINHRGNLFRSQKIFRKEANVINYYLKKWGAVGFRCPSMYHNLDWIHELNIQYDASTFDTDPFEPQPDGAGTIFPFIVPGKDGSNGYVELPYTLPQDHLLHIVMREQPPSTWKTKLDWISEKGGMALVNVHPDYINFSNSKVTVEEYPVEIYREFLEYVKSRYEGQYWNALPKDMAAFVRKSQLFLKHD